MEDNEAPPAIIPVTSVVGGMPYVSCPCGFMTAGPDQESNLCAYQDHDCSESGPWYSHLFSFWGVMTLAILGIVIIELLSRK